MLYPERFTVELCVDAQRIAREHATEFRLFTHAAIASGCAARVSTWRTTAAYHSEASSHAVVSG